MSTVLTNDHLGRGGGGEREDLLFMLFALSFISNFSRLDESKLASAGYKLLSCKCFIVLVDIFGHFLQNKTTKMVVNKVRFKK